MSRALRQGPDFRWERGNSKLRKGELGIQKRGNLKTQEIVKELREWCAVVWERSSAELRGKELAKGCVGTKWHRVGWTQSGAQVCGSEVVKSSVRTE